MLKTLQCNFVSLTSSLQAYHQGTVSHQKCFSEYQGIQKFDSSSYGALGACFNPYKAFLRRLFDVLKQFQNEVNDIRSERLAKSANPLALLVVAQPYSDNYYQAPKPQRSNAPSYMQSSSTRTSASTRHKGKGNAGSQSGLKTTRITRRR
ncbi:hypothetical protein Tco_0202634 [Tanacetum coccineum]